MVRKIKKVFKGKPMIEGAGVRIKRGFGYDQVPQFDPFLMFDDFRNDDPEHYLPGFPWHPHRGIETITYMLEGYAEHGDSMGNKGVIKAGDVQWMTAGSGVIHQEMPKGDDKGRMGGFQLWANLSAKKKMMDPRYRDVKKNIIPQVKRKDGTLIKIIAGKVDGVEGPVKDIVIDPEYLDISVLANITFSHKVNPDHTVFAYVFEGEGYFDKGKDSFDYEVEGKNYFDFKRECLIDSASVVLYGQGDEIQVTTKERPVRFLLISGKPLKEPVAWYGPIVMNTKEEIRKAFEEYNNNTFIKSKNLTKVS
ncbi:MAG: pirin family protein [Candidatus Omnitrophica bacterium]|nr:pirin family protein [Candidatus Omnitrophota bacterium]